MNPAYAQRLLDRMSEDFRLDIKYQFVCELSIKGAWIPVPTIWSTDDTGSCYVKALLNEWPQNRLDDLRMCRLRYQDISFDYWIEEIRNRGPETSLNGVVRGSFGHESDLVTTTDFLVPNLPSSLGHNRKIKTYSEVNDEMVSRQTILDKGALVLKDGPWKITLTNVEHRDLPQHDYAGLIQLCDKTLRTFREHLAVIDAVSLFLTWICGAQRYPAYAVSYQKQQRMAGFLHGFEAPGRLNNRMFVADFRQISEAARSFAYLCDLLRTSDIGLCVRHAITNYAEAYTASNMTSKLANTHAALTAIVRWDQEKFRGSFSFLDQLKSTISSSGLDGTTWDQVASDLYKYRNNSLHVQPKWAYHDDPSAFRVWLDGQELVEALLGRKLNLL